MTTFKVVGVSFCQPQIDSLYQVHGEYTEFIVRADPQNPHDPQAKKVIGFLPFDGETDPEIRVGYITRTQTHLFPDGYVFRGQIRRYQIDDDLTVRYTIWST